MAKIFKVTGYFVDPNGEENSDRLETWLDDYPNMFPKHFQIEECDIGEWDDENPLNDVDSPVSECEQYFITKPYRQPIKFIHNDFKMETDDEGNITLTRKMSPVEIAELFDVPVTDVLNGNLKIGIVYEKE